MPAPMTSTPRWTGWPGQQDDIEAKLGRRYLPPELNPARMACSTCRRSGWPTLGDMNDLEVRPGLTLCMSGKSRPRNRKFRTLPLGRQQAALNPSQGVLPAQWLGRRPQDLGSVRHRPREQGPTRTRVRQLRRSGCCTSLYSRARLFEFGF
jgi:hypothetical protein